MVKDLPSGSAYDFIIVGAGSAGCVLANRLSADPGISVLLLEAGSKDDSPLIHMPGGVGALMKSGKVDWRYHTVPQRHLDGRELYFPRGKVVGGSSSTNAMVAVRGSASDYDRWADLGLTEWSFDNVLPYFKRLETYLPARGEHHGFEGPLRISRIAPRGPMGPAWIDAAKEAGHPANYDFAGAKLEGVGQYDSTLYKGRRQSASVAFLRPALNRSNLTVLTQAHILRLLFEGTRAVGVEYLKGGERSAAHCSEEIILSAGAINSPQILMLSGVGDADQLSAHGIPVIARLDGVGQDLQDHLVAATGYSSPSPSSYRRYMAPHHMIMAGLQYALFGRGIASEPAPMTAGFLKTSPDLAEPDVQYHFLPIIYHDNGRTVPKGHGSMALCNVCRPQSRGTITLRSANPLDPPKIDPNYFAEAYDRRTMIAGIRMAREIASQAAFRAYRGEEIMPGSTAQTNEAIEAYVRAHAESVYHPVGSCRMGSDERAVVDSRLRVHGVQGLRVVDASIMPSIISGNTNLATMMIAEKGADAILNGAP